VGVLGQDRLRPGILLALPLVVVASKLYGLYDRDELVVNKRTLDEAPALFQLATSYTLLIWLSDGLFVDGTLGNGQIVVLWASLAGGALLARRLARTIARGRTEPEHLLFIGDGAVHERLREKLESHAVHAKLVGRLSLQRASDLLPSHASHGPGDHTSLRDLLAEKDVDRVIILTSHTKPDETLELVRAVKATGMRVSLVPHVLDVVGSSVVFDEIAGLTLLGVRRFDLPRSSRLIKRAFDLAGAAAVLVVTAPLFAAIALAIKLTSPGPVLFRQTRIGRDGKPFEICKFRSMVPDAEARKSELQELNEASGLFKMADDPRITGIGRILRKTSLDELPQLLNVLRGEMSLVGPRPLVVDEDRVITGYDRRRLYLTPGMTGHWQILGSARVPLHEMRKIDYLYVTNWSLWNDLKILLRTVPYMLERRGM
jgi:exopolysaccharide biosynthesis polyprenyl glycosylphosphotransferase